MGWIKFWLAKNIRINEIIKPNSKLPPSPKNSLGRFKKEKLNNRKNPIGIDIIINNKRIFSSEIRKYRIANTEIVVTKHQGNGPPQNPKIVKKFISRISGNLEDLSGQNFHLSCFYII